MVLIWKIIFNWRIETINNNIQNPLKKINNKWFNKQWTEIISKTILENMMQCDLCIVYLSWKEKEEKKHEPEEDVFLIVVVVVLLYICSMLWLLFVVVFFSFVLLVIHAESWLSLHEATTCCIYMRRLLCAILFLCQ